MSDERRLASSYLHYLPAIFQEGAGDTSDFIGSFLLAFERILTGLDHPDASSFPPALAELLDGVAGDLTTGAQRFFNPGPADEEAQRAPGDFLEWLAGWVALSLREDWTDDQKRRFISQIVPLYRLRGTPAGLIAMLSIYTDGAPVEIYEFEERPNYFQIRMKLLSDEIAKTKGANLIATRRRQIAMAIIEREKPAHTYYSFRSI